jgi:acetyltransferase-like isoleucine patch superfamily enzyme
MLGRIIKIVGYISSFLFTYRIINKIQNSWQIFYTGWMKRRFKHFEGRLSGYITLISPQYISIGDNTLIEENVRLLAWDTFQDQRFTPEITIGNHCVIQKDCFLSAVNKIEIGNNVAVTEHTIILDNVHGDFQDNHLTFNVNPEIPDVFLQNAYTRPLASKGPVIIEDDVHIGMFCLILPGTVIGHHSVIAAHSVVAKKIPPYSLVAGNPAEVIMTFGKKKKRNY